MTKIKYIIISFIILFLSMPITALAKNKLVAKEEYNDILVESKIENAILLLDNQDNLNYVYYDKNYIYIQKLNTSLKKGDLLKLAIPQNYSILENAITDKDNNYYFGVASSDANLNSKAFAILKYNNKGVLQGTYEYNNESDLQNVFNLNMAINQKGILGFSYNNKLGYINSYNMTNANNYPDYSLSKKSISTDIISLNDNDFLMGIRNNNSFNILPIIESKPNEASLFHFNDDFSYGGLVELENSIALVGSSKTENLFVEIIKKDSLTKEEFNEEDFLTKGIHAAKNIDYGVKWLTNYSNDYVVKNIKALKVKDDGILILWNKYYKDDNKPTNMYYLILNNDGTIRQEEIEIEMANISDNNKPVYLDNYLYIPYLNKSNILRTYKIKIGATTDKTTINGDINNEAIILKSLDNYKLNINSNNNGKIAFKSDNEDVLKVDKNGVVKPKQNGEATVTISLPDYTRIEEKKIKFIIDLSVDDIKFNLDNNILNDKLIIPLSNNLKEYNIKADLYPENTNKNVEFKVIDENILSIQDNKNNNLIIKPIKVGDTKIKASITNINSDGTKTSLVKELKVQVIVPIKKIMTDNSYINLAVKENYQIPITITPDNATIKNINWISKDSNIAKVDESGRIYGNSEGTTSIIGTSTENSNVKIEINVTVKGKIYDNFKVITNGEEAAITGYVGTNNEVEIPSLLESFKVVSIESNVFGTSKKPNDFISKITIPDTVTTIKDCAFSNMNNIKSIMIPKNVTKIGEAITYNSKIEQILVDKENKNYYSKDGVLFENKDNITLKEYPESKQDETFVIPDNASKIGIKAFYNNNYLKSLYIPKNITYIDYNSILNNKNLTNIYISNNNVKIVDYDKKNTAIRNNGNLTINSLESSTALDYATKHLINTNIWEEKITSVSFKKESLEFNKLYETKDINKYINLEPIYATNSKLTYETDNPMVVTIDQKGLITSVNSGEANIIIKLEEDSKEYTIPVKVNIKAMEIKTDKEEYVIEGKQNLKINASITPDNVNNKKLKYKVLDEKIAAINQSGNITPKKNGTTKIIITTTDGSNLTKDNITLTVKKIPNSIKNCTIKSIANKTYTGTPLTPEVVIKDNDYKLIENKDYKLSVKNNINVGSALVKITGMGSYVGEITKSFRINPKTIEQSSITISNLDYKGINFKPEIIVKDENITLKNGTDYIIKYQNYYNKNMGLLEIIGKGNYRASTTRVFTIEKKIIEK